MEELEQLKKEIARLKAYIINLAPYCDNCRHSDNEDNCDECNRKSFNWAHVENFE